MVEMMLGLFLFGLIMCLIIFIMSMIQNREHHLIGVDQNEIGLIQLQHELNFAYDLSFENQQLCYTRLEKRFCLSEDNQSLVKQPGYEVFLLNLNQFEMKLYDHLKIHVNGKNYELKINP